MITVIFPGSFDPPTLGHLDLVRRSTTLFEAVHVVIASNPHKKYSFTLEERLDMMRRLVAPYGNVSVESWDGLVVEYARRVGARVMVRGVRALADFNYEFELSMLNRGLAPEIETLFLPTDPQYFVLRSSSIKELARLGGDISSMVPREIIDEVVAKFNPLTER